MIELDSKYDKVKIFTDNIEEQALSQIITMANSPLGEHAHIRIMPDAHSGIGCTIGTTMVITDKVCPNLVGVDIGCLDKDTEYLTKNGWKTIDTYNNEEILIFDPNSFKAFFEMPKFYIKKPCSSFYYFKNSKGLDQMVSEEHRMLVYSGYKKKGYHKNIFNPLELNKKNLEKGYYSFQAAFYLNEIGLNFLEDFIRLDIMIAADGRIKELKTEEKYAVEMHLSKERKIKRCKELLENNNIFYHLYNQKDGTSVFSFKVNKNINKDLSKYFNANQKELKILAEESLLWDGYKGERSYFSSTNKQNADVIQFAFSANNIRAGISVVKYEKENWKNSYIVTPTKNEKVGYNKNFTIETSQDGFKYCFTTSTGFFVARRNGKIFTTGNCGVDLIKTNIDFEQRWEELDAVIREKIPSGFSVHEKNQINEDFFSTTLFCWGALSEKTRLLALKSLGTLGGGWA